MNGTEFVPDGGLIRLFPLPNLVLFPGAVQPLHIFEPRYRQMTTDALAGDRLIALVLPRPGWDPEYAERPPIHSIACVGRIAGEQRLADGRFNLLLQGIHRLRIVEEVKSAKLYRLARAELLNEIPCADVAQEADLRGQVRERAPEWFRSQSELRDQFLELIAGELALGMIVDLIAFALPLDAEFKQVLLEELDVSRRVEMLLRQLSRPRSFPPDFSTN